MVRLSNDVPCCLLLPILIQFQNLLAELSRCADRFLEEASKYGEVSSDFSFSSLLFVVEIVWVGR